MNPENWSTEDFRNKFHSLNKEKIDSNGSKVESIRMRRNLDRVFISMEIGGGLFTIGKIPIIRYLYFNRYLLIVEHQKYVRH